MVLTNIPKLDCLGIRSPAQSLHYSLGGLDVTCVVEGNQGAGFVFEKRFNVEAQEGSGCIRLNVITATKENGIEFY